MMRMTRIDIHSICVIRVLFYETAMPEVVVNDVTLHYTSHGHGQPLLLLHGGWGLSIKRVKNS